MYMTSLLLAAATASLSWAAAVPQPAAEDSIAIEARGPNTHNTVFHITEFHAQSIPHSSEAKVTFYVKGTSDNPEQRFAKTRCHAVVSDSETYQELLPVPRRQGVCQDPSVQFEWNKYVTGDIYGGWALGITNQFNHQELDLL
jgi:hypothetical protein